jgi:hypothetical protein
MGDWGTGPLVDFEDCRLLELLGVTGVIGAVFFLGRPRLLAGLVVDGPSDLVGETSGSPSGSNSDIPPEPLSSSDDIFDEFFF